MDNDDRAPFDLSDANVSEGRTGLRSSDERPPREGRFAVVGLKHYGSTPFGEQLKKMRCEKDWTMPELAALAGLLPQQISGYENRGAKPAFSKLLMLSAALDCPLDILCEEELRLAYEQVDENRRRAIEAQEQAHNGHNGHVHTRSSHCDEEDDESPTR